MNLHQILDENLKEAKQTYDKDIKGLGTPEEQKQEELTRAKQLELEQHKIWMGLERTSLFFRDLQKQTGDIGVKIASLIEKADPKEDYALRKLLAEQMTLQKILSANLSRQ